MKEEKIFFVDYSEVYYLGVATALPDRRAGKFVQLRHDNAEYLVFSPKELTAYHADIVERFCLEKDIPGVYNLQSKRFIIHDPEWVVVGGGKFEINAVQRYVLLYDNSMAYGRFDPHGLEDKIRGTEELKDYEVEIQ